MAANFFDFHFHPMFKQYISNYEEQYPSARPLENLMTEVTENNDIMNFLDEKVFHFLDSQCSFNEMAAGNDFLGVANIVTLEYGIATSTNLLGYILRSAITAPLDKEYFNRISEGSISYFQLMLKELNLYSRLANIGSQRDPKGSGKITLLTRKSKTVDLDNVTGITLALSLEGGHNLNRTLINKDVSVDNLDTPPATANPDKIYADFQNTTDAPLTPAQSLQRLFQAMWQEDMDLVYLTLTHLTYITEVSLATHAFGMKLLKNPSFFYPTGKGLTDAGKEVIAAAYSMSPDNGVTSTPILIDIKHMSLKSRLDFYDYRNTLPNKQPILATHMGVTGYSIANWKNAIIDSETQNIDNQTYKISVPPKLAGIDNSGDELTICKYKFNPWCINLMDEDIVEILNSNGMIGMILDARILGAKATFANLEYDPSEYLSDDEYNFFFNEQHSITYQSPELPAQDANPAMSFNLGNSFSGDEDTQDPDREVACLAFNILHILAVGISKTNIDAWGHIAIGSDYDGLIEPLSAAYTCTDISIIETKLNEMMILAEPSYMYHNPIPDKFGKILPRTTAGDVDKDILSSKIRNIMFDNGKNFLKNWYGGSL